MFNFIWRMGCLTIILVVTFFIFALLKGGEPLRQIAHSSETLIEKIAESLAEKADDIKKTKDNFIDTIKKWTER